MTQSLLDEIMKEVGKCWVCCDINRPASQKFCLDCIESAAERFAERFAQSEAGFSLIYKVKEEFREELVKSEAREAVLREGLEWIATHTLRSKIPDAIGPSSEEIYNDRYERICKAREALQKAGEIK